MQATCSLGFSHEIRKQIENNISPVGEAGPSPECFDTPVKYVLVILEEVKGPKICRVLSRLVISFEFYRNIYQNFCIVVYSRNI